MDAKKRYQKTQNACIQVCEARIKELASKADRAKSAATTELRSELDALRAKLDAAKQQLRKMRMSSGKAWEELKVGFEDAWNDLTQAVDRAADKFR